MKKKKNTKRTVLIILLILLAAACAAFIVLRMTAGRTNYVKDSDIALQLETETERPLHAADVYALDEVRPVDEERTEGTYALLVIGGDNPGAEGRREDASAVILMIVNHNMGKVYFASMRTDLYVRIPAAEDTEAAAGTDDGADTGTPAMASEGSLGHAYAIGGGPLLARTIEENYGIHMDNYASISLKDVARIIGMEEFEQINVSEDGLQVIKELVYSLNAVNPAQVAGYVAQLLPYVTHNISGEQLMRIIMQIPAIVGYYSEDENIPYEGKYVSLDGYTVPDIGYTSARMQEMIYGEDQGKDP